MELLFDEAGIVVAILRFQRLVQTEQRARVPRILFEIFAEDLLRSLQQGGPDGILLR